MDKLVVAAGVEASGADHDGADDPIVPEINGRLLARRLPDARLQIVDCGHLFIISQPEQTARTVETFITDARRAVSA